MTPVYATLIGFRWRVSKTPKNGKQGSSNLRGWDFQSNTRRACSQKMVICLLSERFRCTLQKTHSFLLFRFFFLLPVPLHHVCVEA